MEAIHFGCYHTHLIQNPSLHCFVHEYAYSRHSVNVPFDFYSQVLMSFSCSSLSYHKRLADFMEFELVNDLLILHTCFIKSRWKKDSPVKITHLNFLCFVDTDDLSSSSLHLCNKVSQVKCFEPGDIDSE